MTFSLEQFANRIRFQQLLLFSLAILVTHSVLLDSFWMKQLLNFFYLNALWVALSASGVRMAWRYVFLGLWSVSAVLHNVDMHGHEPLRLLLVNALGAGLLAFCVGGIVQFVLQSERVSADTLYAAAIGYLLVAILFGQLYVMTNTLLPGSFVFANVASAPEGAALEHALDYFSFVTLATLGYGDITPVHPLARMLASIEAVVGQFYVAVLVAWLVSRYVRDSENSNSEEQSRS